MNRNTECPVKHLEADEASPPVPGWGAILDISVHDETLYATRARDSRMNTEIITYVLTDKGWEAVGSCSRH